MQSSLHSTDLKVLSGFRRELNQYLKYSKNLCKAYELSSSQYQILLQLVTNPHQPINLKTLAENLQISVARLKNQLKVCEKSGYLSVEKYNRAKEANVKVLSSGIDIVNQLASLHLNHIEGVMNSLSVGSCKSHCTSPICWKETD